MKTISRRQLLAISAATAATVPVLALTGRALAADARLDPNDAQASALSYVHESPDPGKLCSNCALYTGDAGAEWGPCNIFPGKQVAAAGWCSAWVAKP